jgi:hypothetical protein
MSISARFNQSSIEVKRYLLQYQLQLAAGEYITAVTCTITSSTDEDNNGGFQITSIAIAPSPNNYEVAFFASCATPSVADLNVYNANFVATTSLGQVLQDVVVYNIQNKLDNAP